MVPAGRRRSSAGRSECPGGSALRAARASIGIATRRADHRRDPRTPVDQRRMKGLGSASSPPGSPDQSTSPVTVQPPGSGTVLARKPTPSRLIPAVPPSPGAPKAKSRSADSIRAFASRTERTKRASFEIRSRLARTVAPGSSTPARNRTPSIGTSSPVSRTSICQSSSMGSRTVPSKGRAGAPGPTSSSPRNARPRSVEWSTAVIPADRVEERPWYSSSPECSTSRWRPNPRRILGTMSRRANGGGPSRSDRLRLAATSTASLASTVEILGGPVRERSIDARKWPMELPFGKRTPSPFACERIPASEMLTRSVVVCPTRTFRASITIRPSTTWKSSAPMTTGRPVAAVARYSAVGRRSPGSRASQAAAPASRARTPPRASSTGRSHARRREGEAAFSTRSGPSRSARPVASGCFSRLISRSRGRRRHERGAPTHSASASASTSAGWKAWRAAPSAIWRRQLVPPATILAPAAADRTAGRSETSPIRIETSKCSAS